MFLTFFKITLSPAHKFYHFRQVNLNLNIWNFCQEISSQRRAVPSWFWFKITSGKLSLHSIRKAEQHFVYAYPSPRPRRIRKNPLVGPWGVLPRCFQLKYSRIHLRNLSHKVELQTLHKNSWNIPRHASTS